LKGTTEKVHGHNPEGVEEALLEGLAKGAVERGGIEVQYGEKKKLTGALKLS